MPLSLTPEDLMLHGCRYVHGLCFGPDCCFPKQAYPRLSLAVLRYSLRSQLFVGETYTLEVLDSAETHAGSVEFTVDEPDGPQTVQVLVDRKWRDVTVQLRHQMGASGEVQHLPAGITVRARHDVVSVETTSGVTPTGGVSAKCHLQGAEALYVGQPYTLLVEGGSGLSVISDGQIVVPAGGQSAVFNLIVDRACGEVEVRLSNALAGSGHWAESLPLPASVPFVVCDTVSTSTVKMRGLAGKEGATIKRNSQLYVGRTYLLKLEATELLMPASIEFGVTEERNVVTLPVQRAVGPVTALLRTQYAGDFRHWAEPLPLPEAFSFRVLHKSLNAVVHEAEVRQPTAVRTNTESVELPMLRNLFVGEEYVIEAGYQGEVLATKARAEVEKFMERRHVHFNPASDAENFACSKRRPPSPLAQGRSLLIGKLQRCWNGWSSDCEASDALAAADEAFSGGHAVPGQLSAKGCLWTLATPDRWRFTPPPLHGRKPTSSSAGAWRLSTNRKSSRKTMRSSTRSPRSWLSTPR